MSTSEDSWMSFEIIGAICQIETFAVGCSIRVLSRLKKVTVKGAGASAKELPLYVWPTVI